MGRRPNLAPTPPTHATRTAPSAIAARGWLVCRSMIAMAVTAALAGCSTLPDPRMDPHGREMAYSVVEMAPGWWHVLVRVNYFSSAEAAERLLRERVADLCPDGDLVLENLQVIGHPRMASADAHCAGAEPPPDMAATPLPDDDVSGPSDEEGGPADDESDIPPPSPTP